MFFFSILGICVEKTYISMRPWAQQCKSNGQTNLFMILAVSLAVFFLVVALYCFIVYIVYILLLLLWNTSFTHFYLEFKYNKDIIIGTCARLKQRRLQSCQATCTPTLHSRATSIPYSKFRSKLCRRL